MDDLNAKLGAILNDPAAMKEIAALASSLGVDAQSAQPAPAPAPTPVDSMGLGAMSALMPLLGSFKAEDETTRLLDAIRV